MNESTSSPEQSLNIKDSVLEGVQIGGIAGRDLSLTQIQGGVHYTNVNNYIGLDSGSGRTSAQPKTEQEYRYRQVLLEKVKEFWIRGVLEKSLHNQTLIELGLEKHTDVVKKTVEYQEFAEEPIQPLPEGTTAESVFKDLGAGRTLLILGQPGSGKTTTLLKLAQSLINKAELDQSQAIPVVLNLSSWGQKPKQTIVTWLVQELKRTYQCSDSLGKLWIKNEALILLLDGLDEVEEKYRNDCVKELNIFLQEYGVTELVVCCRVLDYKNLSERLMLRSAICVQLLTLKQINHYLNQAEEQLSALKEVIQCNVELQEFASSPLILNIMSLTYQGCSLEQLGHLDTPRLFDAYIKRMFQRKRITTDKYSEKDAKRWLTWIAKRMVQTSQTVFFIERIQPVFLLNRYQRLWYRLESALIFGLIGGLIYGLDYGLSNGLIGGLIGGLSNGLIGGLIVGFLGDIKTVETLKWSWKEAKDNIRSGLNYGMIFGMIFGLFYGLFYGLRKGLNYGLSNGLIGGLIGGLVGGLVCGLFFGLIGGLIVGLIGGFRGPEIQNKLEANQGIWKSAHNALIVGLIVGLSSGPIFGMIYGLWSGLWSGMIYGLCSGMIGGGTACLRHFVLRFKLFRMGYIPWNYAHFLDYSAEHLFLQKVGGGYIFIHRMLLEHFAQMELAHGKN